jgi:integrase
MQKAYFNFVNSLNSKFTKKVYIYRLGQFLSYYKLDLNKFLKLPQQKMTNMIIEYLVQMKVSKQTKNVIFFAIKHACEINDIILNFKRINKFVKSEKTGNEISGKDRGYTHEEIQKILEFSDQRVKTAFLILASTGIRIGALESLRFGDLERIDDLYKVTVYSGEKEQYITFTTPEASKEIDAYLDFRKRRQETINNNSYLIVKKFKQGFKSEPFKGDSLKALLRDTVENSGLREIDHGNMYKRKQVPVLHGLRKFTTKQLVDSKVNPEIREMLLGHKIGLTGVYYKPTEQEMLNEYLKAVPLLTISNEERLKFKLEERIQIEKSEIQKLNLAIEDLRRKMKKR